MLRLALMVQLCAAAAFAGCAAPEAGDGDGPRILHASSVPLLPGDVRVWSGGGLEVATYAWVEGDRYHIDGVAHNNGTRTLTRLDISLAWYTADEEHVQSHEFFDTTGDEVYMAPGERLPFRFGGAFRPGEGQYAKAYRVEVMPYTPSTWPAPTEDVSFVRLDLATGGITMTVLNSESFRRTAAGFVAVHDSEGLEDIQDFCVSVLPGEQAFRAFRFRDRSGVLLAEAVQVVYTVNGWSERQGDFCR